ncbi:MAG: GFA family protein [Paracoccaceae bacterium]
MEIELLGQPIVSMVCHCSSCQTAGKWLDNLPQASGVLDPQGGTAFVLFRKDRVRCVHGDTHLDGFRLKPDSPTRRVVATCCNSAMFLDFTKGHWISIYQGRLNPDAMLMARKSGFFMPRLLFAWAAMAFQTPVITYVKDRTDRIISATG